MLVFSSDDAQVPSLIMDISDTQEVDPQMEGLRKTLLKSSPSGILTQVHKEVKTTTKLIRP